MHYTTVSMKVVTRLRSLCKYSNSRVFSNVDCAQVFETHFLKLFGNAIPQTCTFVFCFLFFLCYFYLTGRIMGKYFHSKLKYVIDHDMGCAFSRQEISLCRKDSLAHFFFKWPFC